MALPGWKPLSPSPNEAAWLASLRREALAHLDASGLPTTKNEAWRYTSVRALSEIPFACAPGASLAGIEALVAPHRLPFAAGEIVVVNGRVEAGLSRWPEVEGLSVRALAGELGDEALATRLGRLAPWREAAFLALNTAWLQDGLDVRVAAGVEVAAPLHVIVVGRSESAPVAAHLRTLVELEAGARLEIVESHVVEGQSLVTHVVEAAVGPGASLGWQVEGATAAGANLVHVLGARLERDARLRTHGAWLGGGVTRSEILATLAGPGSEAVLDGLYVLGDASHVDVHTVVDHAVPHTTSSESYKAVLGGQARAVFDGRVVVRPDAQRTDAAQNCRTMLLSPEADMNARPTLVIEADDVKCSHGVAVGQLDRAQQGYLVSRGIPHEVARRMLTVAFVADRVDAVPDARLRERLAERVSARLSRLQDPA